MPRSRNLGPGAPGPGNDDLYKKMISKMSLFERGSRILESRGPGGYGGGGAQIPESGHPLHRTPLDLSLIHI